MLALKEIYYTEGYSRVSTDSLRLSHGRYLVEARPTLPVSATLLGGPKHKKMLTAKSCLLYLPDYLSCVVHTQQVLLVIGKDGNSSLVAHVPGLLEKEV